MGVDSEVRIDRHVSCTHAKPLSQALGGSAKPRWEVPRGLLPLEEAAARCPRDVARCECDPLGCACCAQLEPSVAPRAAPASAASAGVVLSAVVAGGCFRR